MPDIKEQSVPWSWVAMFAVSLVVLLIGNSWKASQEQAAEDRAQLKSQSVDIASVKTQVERVQVTVESLTKKSDARWDALLSALPDVDKRIKEQRRVTPVFAPEWHPRQQ